MKKIPFKNASFFCSAFQDDQLPTLRDASKRTLPEIAIVGRSNVGKSSLINHLLNRVLAKTSSKPGKTQSINFFLIDDALALVDLPGYGYAKVSKEIREEWGAFINTYLEKRTSLKLILFLMDIRRIPSEEDCAFIQWAHFHKKPLLIIFTKTDKLKDHEIKKATENAVNTITAQLDCTPCTFLHYSIKSLRARIDLINTINKQL